MEQPRFSSRKVDSPWRLQKGFALWLAAAFWLVGIFHFMDRTGYSDAFREATEGLEESYAGLVLVLFLLPTLYAIFVFATSEYRPSDRVPGVLRLSAQILSITVRGLAAAVGYLILTSTFRFIPETALIPGFFVYLLFLIALAIRQVIRQRAAKRTVTALYEAIKNDEPSVLAALCDPEALDGLDAIDSKNGKLTWYRVMDLMLEDMHFTYLVESIRNTLPRFEEVTILPDGNRVVQVMAEGI